MLLFLKMMNKYQYLSQLNVEDTYFSNNIFPRMKRMFIFDTIVFILNSIAFFRVLYIMIFANYQISLLSTVHFLNFAFTLIFLNRLLTAEYTFVRKNFFYNKDKSFKKICNYLYSQPAVVEEIFSQAFNNDTDTDKTLLKKFTLEIQNKNLTENTLISLTSLIEEKTSTDIEQKTSTDNLLYDQLLLQTQKNTDSQFKFFNK